MLNLEQWKQQWLLEEATVFQGWDFAYLNGRIQEEALPWDYKQILSGLLDQQDRLLDMGTGGGEFLLSLNHPYELTYVTESYPPNVALCQHTLEPLGIHVEQIFSDEEIPYPDACFDVVINRHESFDLAEVYRVLKPRGLFVTQQVGGLNNKALSKRLIPDFVEMISSEFSLERSVLLAKSLGFEVVKQAEYYPSLHFYDIGALVYFAKIIEWEFPGFSVEGCFEVLCQLQQEIEQQGYIESKEHRFMLVLQKP